MLRERWADAGEVFTRVRRRDQEVAMRERLCRNLDAMRTHRPGVYRTLVEAEASERYRIINSSAGALTVAFQHDNAQQTVLSGDGDPLGAVQKVMTSVDAAYRGGAPLGLASIGDGYLLAHLSANPPLLILGREQSITLIEPDAQLALACLMLHDYTGPRGAIEQQRIRWYVGPEWLRDLREDFFSDLMLNYPQVTLKLGLSSQRIDDALRGFLLAISELEARLSAEVNRHERTLTASFLTQLFGDRPPRRPRVLVVTTRFSTVLQYSARDSAETFEQLGWDTNLLIEPTPSHGLNRIAIRAAIAEFKPDLIFLIDHLRQEYGGMYPPNLPVVCWVQDHLPNLTNADAGRKLTRRDFALIASVQRYVTNYAYPPRQCMEFRKLTRVPVRPAEWRSDGDDLLYVSNWSQPPEELAGQMVGELGERIEPRLIGHCCARMLELYARGGALYTVGQVRELVEIVQCELKSAPLDDQTQLLLLNQLFERLNNALFRQQGLAWAAEVAKTNGWTLSIYGNGWQQNPRFRQHARGYVAYGAELEDLTRRSKINLLLEPYVCVTHQRLLDGLVAGGFFLMRRHPLTAALESLIALLSVEPLKGAVSIEAARRTVALDEPRALMLEHALAATQRHDARPGATDVIRAIRDLQSVDCFPLRGPLLPELAAISFDSPAELERVVRAHLADEPSRRRIAAAQRQAVEGRMSYRAGLARMIEWIRTRLDEEARETAKAPANAAA
jgi:hypothetical protein